MTHRYSSAEELYETFQGFPSQEQIVLPIRWPAQFCLLGRALDISYYSLKRNGGGDGKGTDFIHLHNTPCALLAGSGVVPFGRHLSPPPGGEFAVLGWALDLSFDHEELGEKTIDFADMIEYPWLAADYTKGLLLILPSWGGDPLVIWGPQLRVESRGIVG